MGRFDPKYSDEQKEALISAQVDAGMSAAEATAYAAEGKYEGLDPFVVPQSTASYYASEERKRRSGRDLKKKEVGTPNERLEVSTQRLLSVFGRYVELAEHRQKRIKGKADGTEFERLRKLATFGREVGALVKGVPTAGGGSPGKVKAAADRAEKEKVEADSKDEDLVASMIRENGLEVEPGRRGRPPQQNGDTA